ncbi:hypothetical protein C8Q74DRAFT_1336607 [Fomes fomentarius]|nr:hypothetical protein C8Q74DRAFT_1336607 [Fomes fomentarius]
MASTVVRGWQAEPDFRGTFSILSSCLGTLFLCVWTALHVDIPQVDSVFRKFLDKTGWVLVGLLVPELLLWVAFQQSRAAHALTSYAQEQLYPPPEEPAWLVKKIRQVLGLEVSSSHCFSYSGSREHPWTLRHSYYAIMGGFILHDPYSQKQGIRYLPHWQGDGVLTEAGLRYLMQYQPDLIPDIPRAHIDDRSKASALGKIFVVVQVLWFCVNCGNRFAQRLPLSLLEVATIAHALCTFFTYLLWWQKPQDISQPTVIAGDRARQAREKLSLPDPPSTRPLVAPVAHLQEATFALKAHSDAEPGASGSRQELILIAVLTLMYGFVHMLGWTAAFPTALEQSLWRYSTLVVMGSGLVLDIAIYLVGRVRVHLQGRTLTLSYRLAAIVAKVVVVGIPILYLVASAYLVGESSGNCSRSLARLTSCLRGATIGRTSLKPVLLRTQVFAYTYTMHHQSAAIYRCLYVPSSLHHRPIRTIRFLHLSIPCHGPGLLNSRYRTAVLNVLFIVHHKREYGYLKKPFSFCTSP